jgi:anti-sigma factor (TIGR02949 family)
MTGCDCGKCEELLQPYLDRELTQLEEFEAKAHLDLCDPCRRRYVFEEKLRMFVRQASDVPMPPDLKQRLAELRIAL